MRAAVGQALLARWPDLAGRLATALGLEVEAATSQFVPAHHQDPGGRKPRIIGPTRKNRPTGPSGRLASIPAASAPLRTFAELIGLDFEPNPTQRWRRKCRRARARSWPARGDESIAAPAPRRRGGVPSGREMNRYRLSCGRSCDRRLSPSWRQNRSVLCVLRLVTRQDCRLYEVSLRRFLSLLPPSEARIASLRGILGGAGK